MPKDFTKKFIHNFKNHHASRPDLILTKDLHLRCICLAFRLGGMPPTSLNLSKLRVRPRRCSRGESYLTLISSNFIFPLPSLIISR